MFNPEEFARKAVFAHLISAWKKMFYILINGFIVLIFTDFHGIIALGLGSLILHSVSIIKDFINAHKAPKIIKDLNIQYIKCVKDIEKVINETEEKE